MTALQRLATNASSVFVDPPEGLSATHTWVPHLYWLAFIPAVVIGWLHIKRTGSPLFLWCTLSGLFLYPFVVEPLGDFFVAVWYPVNQAIAATPFGRPIPWFLVGAYGAGIPMFSVLAYEIAKRSSPTKLLSLVVLVTVIEVPSEIFFAKWGVMHYYGNHALIYGQPIYNFAQNGGFFVVIAWTLALVLPRTHGWRWFFVPFVVAAVLPLLAWITTWPAYLAIHTGAGPVLGWTAGIASLLLNVAVVVWCARSPQLRRLRDEHGAASNPRPLVNAEATR